MTTPDADGLLAEQLLRLTRRVHRIQKRHLEQRELGITPAQSRLLRTLAHYELPAAHGRSRGAPGSGAPRRDDAGRRRWRRAARCAGCPIPTNRRVIRIELTDDGRKALRELRGARRAAAEEILAPLTDEQREVLGGLLDTLVDGAGAPPGRRC